MLTIQDVGTQILTGNPSKFYVFSGSEYGIKSRYLDNLKDHYNGNVSEVASVSEVLSMMSRKQLIPRVPTLYVVRYDEDYVASLSDSSESEIDSCNICGTLVCIYELDKHAKKLDKYLPNYTVHIDSVSKQFIFKYLKSEFPKVSDRLLKVSASISGSYNQARNLCRSISYDVEGVEGLTDDMIASTFGLVSFSQSSQVRAGVASRNCEYLLRLLDSYEDTYDSVMYTMLSTMLELEKILTNKRAQSDIRQYASRWTLKDVYYYFQHVYAEIKRLRSTTSNGKASIVYLASLLAFREIPSKEDLR